MDHMVNSRALRWSGQLLTESRTSKIHPSRGINLDDCQANSSLSQRTSIIHPSPGINLYDGQANSTVSQRTSKIHPSPEINHTQKVRLDFSQVFRIISSQYVVL